MKIYDEENLPYDGDDDDMAGYSFVEDNSIFKVFAPEAEQETIATPIPQNESTVIIDSPNVVGLADGQRLSVAFERDGTFIYNGETKAGALKPAFTSKLKSERGGQKVAAYYKKSVPAMVRLVFGEEGEIIPLGEESK